MNFDIQKKLGGVPVWAWVIVGVGAIYLLQRYKGKSTTAGTVDTTAGTDASASTEPSSPYGNTALPREVPEPLPSVPAVETTTTTAKRPTTTPGYRGGALPPRVVKKKKPSPKAPASKKKPAHHAQHATRRTARPATPHKPTTSQAAPHVFTRSPDGVIQPYIQHYGGASSSSSGAITPVYGSGTT